MTLRDSENIYNAMKKDNSHFPDFPDFLINMGNLIKEKCLTNSYPWIWHDITNEENIKNAQINSK